LEKLFKDQSQGDKSLKIDVTAEGLSINIYDRSQKPVFHPDTDVFTDYGSWVFNTLAWEIARYNTFRIELEGHTETLTNDAREATRKWELSTERANAARRKIVTGGVGTAQICKVSGFADTAPMAETFPSDEANRRVTVLVKIKESVSALPDALKADLPHDAAPN
jgi:chemotaxis protein MotB